MADNREKFVVNVKDVEPMEISHGSRFAATIKGLGRQVASEGVGCNWFEVPPGKTAFPFHYHCATHEAIYILEGSGVCRLGDKEIDLQEGDFIQFPLGPDYPHQLTNSGQSSLRYLCFSTKPSTDIVGYPDSNKIAAMSSPSIDHFATPWVRSVFNADDTVGYYDGEEIN